MGGQMNARCEVCRRDEVPHYVGKRSDRKKPEILRPCISCRRARRAKDVCPLCKGSGRVPHEHPVNAAPRAVALEDF